MATPMHIPMLRPRHIPRGILPIPALDGVHVMFLIYEVVTQRKPNEKFMEYAQIAGMVLLFGLLIYANGMDLIRAIF